MNHYHKANWKRYHLKNEARSVFGNTAEGVVRYARFESSIARTRIQ